MKNKLFLLLPALALVFGLSACDNGPMNGKGTSGNSSNTSHNGNSSNGSSNNSSGSNASSDGGNQSSDGGGTSSEDGGIQNTDYSFKVNDGTANVFTTEGAQQIVDEYTEEVLGMQYQFQLNVEAEQVLTFFKGAEAIYPGAGLNPGNEANNVSCNISTQELKVVKNVENSTCYLKVYSDGYAIWLTGNEGGTGGGNFDPDEGGGGSTESYGLIINDTTVIPGVLDGEDYQHRPQYKITNFSASIGDVIKVRNIAAEESFIPLDLDSASFNGHVSTYLEVSESSYTVKKAFTADVYIKVAFENDSIYFGLIGGDDPVDMSNYKTVYLFRPNDWADWSEPHVYYWYDGTPSEDYAFNDSPKMVSVLTSYTHTAISKTGEVYAYALPKTAKGLIFFRWTGGDPASQQVEKQFTTTWADETNNAFYLDYDGSDKMVATTFAESNLVFGLVGSSPLSWDSDQLLSISNGVGSYELVASSANVKFKVRRDHAWTINYGFDNLDNESSPLCTKDSDGNAMLKAAGTYTISFNVATSQIHVVQTA